MKTALSTSTKLREKNIMIGELREVILRVNVLLINIFVKQIIKQLISYQYFKFQDNYYLSLKLRPRQSTTTTISSPPLPSTSRQPRKRSKTRSESQCYFRVFCNYKSKREAKSPCQCIVQHLVARIYERHGRQKTSVNQQYLYNTVLNILRLKRLNKIKILNR